MDDIRTDRLILRTPRASDLEDFLRYRNDPAAMDAQGLDPVDEATAAAFLADQAALPPHAAGWIMFAVQLREPACVIGEVGLFLSDPGSRQGDVGWSIVARRQRQGYATEAARALLDYAFSARRLHRVTAGCQASNTASVRLMERLGMRREGVLLQSVQRRGEWIDEYRYALLQREWPQQRVADAL